MPQSLVLFKKLPYAEYLADLQAREVYRATMTFLPGGCYAGAAFRDASPMYARSASLQTGGGTAGACPYPDDQLACLEWEVLAAVRKVSPNVPLAYNSFAFLEVERGMTSRLMELVVETGGSDDRTTNYVERETGLEYVAAAHLIGCGSYNVLLEVLADDHDRMLEVLHACTDTHIVRQYSVGRLAAKDAHGFGEDNAAGSAGIVR